MAGSIYRHRESPPADHPAQEKECAGHTASPSKTRCQRNNDGPARLSGLGRQPMCAPTRQMKTQVDAALSNQITTMTTYGAETPEASDKNYDYELLTVMK